MALEALDLGLVPKCHRSRLMVSRAKACPLQLALVNARRSYHVSNWQ